MRKEIAILLLMLLPLTVGAQRFFNLTSDQVEVDSVLPFFGYSFPLSGDYQDSVYTATILYPEFIDMTSDDIAAWRRLSQPGDTLPALPEARTDVVVSRRQGSLETSFCPLVFRDGRYQILVSFMLRIDSKPLRRSVRQARAVARASAADRYAAHSVLATGNWAKIRVPSTGVYQLTDALIRQAGFTDLSRVKVYGYGGALQSERLDGDELVRLDDLKEVEQCVVNGRHLFHAQGPVSWSSRTAARRTRNPYSDYGYYFITQTDSVPLTTDSASFLRSFYPSAADYHSLYEVDGYSWYHGGRNLFDPEPIQRGRTKTVLLTNPGGSATGRLTVSISAGTASTAEISLNGTVLGRQTVTLGSYDKGNENSTTYVVDNLHATDTVSITTTSGGPVRLDFVSIARTDPAPAPDLARATFPVPTYVYNITNQDHHADTNVDMVIIIPTSQKLLEQARRLKAFHESHDSLSVRIVPADELYNEFASGTPDANAYRRYLKMMYDRATGEADMPKYVLLFGDCVWDNRMLTTDTRSLSPDDYLLCFESENSFNEVTCYVDDGFFCLLDDGEGTNPQRTDKLDMAVGRFPVTSDAQAKVMVDKTIAYATNQNAGAWQNTIMFMADDGNGNLHMRDVNDAAEDIAARYPGYQVKKVMWEAYKREQTSTGNRYPEASAAIRQQQQQGALIMDYGGHGSENQISHEAVLMLADFEGFTNQNLPLWITASCDIMPFDGTTATIGETAVLNPNGGAVAFYGTTRTVYANLNKILNMAFLRRVLSIGSDGRPTTIGMAQMLAKNDMLTTAGGDRTTNKLQYSLLGDPALALNLPTLTVVVDSINGMSVSSASRPTLKAGTLATVSGHIGQAGDFEGVVTMTVRDSRELITCNNYDVDADTVFTYYDRTKTIYTGSAHVQGGRFSISFIVPKDINYTNATGLINLYAVDESHRRVAHGHSDDFLIGGSDLAGTDSIGPDVYCYLNSAEFVDGGKVNTTPYFVAQVSDPSGINATGTGIGHDLQLIVDGSPLMTYNLNDNFAYDFGSYTSGSTYYNIPALEPGSHKLQFRAWDLLNNSTTRTLRFEVVKGLEPTIFSVSAIDNPATTSTTFVVGHDRMGSNVDITLEVFDASGRILWRHDERGISTTTAYTYTWNLTADNGSRLQTGVYLYRVRMSSDGSQQASKAKKLIVVGNK